jgi:hypothetical protein
MIQDDKNKLWKYSKKYFGQDSETENYILYINYMVKKLKPKLANQELLDQSFTRL